MSLMGDEKRHSDATRLALDTAAITAATNPQTYRLAQPIPARFIRKPAPGKYGEYVPHYVVVQAIIAAVGPYGWELVQIVRGDSSGYVKRKGDKEAKLVEARGVVVGVVYRMTVTVDGRELVIEEAGENDTAYMEANDGARLKKATSDALKRCAMRLGVALHLWCKTTDEFFLPRLLWDRAQGADVGHGHDTGEEVVVVGLESDEGPPEPDEYRAAKQVVLDMVGGNKAQAREVWDAALAIAGDDDLGKLMEAVAGILAVKAQAGQVVLDTRPPEPDEYRAANDDDHGDDRDDDHGDDRHDPARPAPAEARETLATIVNGESWATARNMKILRETLHEVWQLAEDAGIVHGSRNRGCNLPTCRKDHGAALYGALRSKHPKVQHLGDLKREDLDGFAKWSQLTLRTRLAEAGQADERKDESE